MQLLAQRGLKFRPQVTGLPRSDPLCCRLAAGITVASDGVFFVFFSPRERVWGKCSTVLLIFFFFF